MDDSRSLARRRSSRSRTSRLVPCKQIASRTVPAAFEIVPCLTLAGLNFNAKRYEGEIVVTVQELPTGNVPGAQKPLSILIEWSQIRAER